MKHLFFPCPYTGAPRCGKHIGYCSQCRQYGKLTLRDRVISVTLVIALLISLLIVLVSCSNPKVETEYLTSSHADQPVQLVKVDSCEYLVANGAGIVHKENCSSYQHLRQYWEPVVMGDYHQVSMRTGFEIDSAQIYIYNPATGTDTTIWLTKGGYANITY